MNKIIKNNIKKFTSNNNHSDNNQLLKKILLIINKEIKNHMIISNGFDKNFIMNYFRLLHKKILTLDSLIDAGVMHVNSRHWSINMIKELEDYFSSKSLFVRALYMNGIVSSILRQHDDLDFNVLYYINNTCWINSNNQIIIKNHKNYNKTASLIINTINDINKENDK